jgi:hypothetical protein
MNERQTEKGNDEKKTKAVRRDEQTDMGKSGYGAPDKEAIQHRIK